MDKQALRLLRLATEAVFVHALACHMLHKSEVSYVDWCFDLRMQPLANYKCRINLDNHGILLHPVARKVAQFEIYEFV